MKIYKPELIFSFTLIILLVPHTNTSAHPTDVPDLPRIVTSDFGPRDVGCSRFHQGVDWAYGTGDSVPLLEDAIVETIARGSASGGYLVRLEITGNSSMDHTFRYLHLFNSSATIPIFVGDYILAYRTGSTDNEELVIIKRDVMNDRRAEYMISSEVGHTVDVVFPGDTVATRIKNSSNTADAATVAVLNTTDHPTVGPAGTSGGVDPHLHIDYGFGSFKNIYYDMAEKVSDFTVRLLDKNNLPRLDGFVVGPNDANSYFLKVEVDSRTGLDLEELGVFVDFAISGNLVREYIYGGKTKVYDPVNTNLRRVSGNGTTCVEGPDVSTGNNNGVHNFSNVAGWEHFIYTDWGTSAVSVTPAVLSEGEHTLLFRLLDIRDNIPFSSGINPSIKFNVDKTAPTSSLVVTTTP